MVEASGYIFQDVEALLTVAKEAITEAEIERPDPGAYDRYRESLNSSMKKLDEISSRYRDDAEAHLIRMKLAEFLKELDSGDLSPEIEAEHLDGIIERVHHIVEWRRLSMASGRDLSLKSRRRTREDVQKR
ncbi:hypothetical protein P0O24_04375 [Methanotrichaceae archaeon M04Ac]|uniref:Uncharacterized protein n=1 Tax=Candidatus Methanocrinis alkalitolerans TaxID=3033395 RepID=A0ABT5XDN3_9EURY|nr:hypothetical protein [Candidatus Methanocrinis alkalitolerans]MDF0592814.1 hypothetical protein [Candidatus Methanocrinis alkalitolerans]